MLHVAHSTFATHDPLLLVLAAALCITSFGVAFVLFNQLAAAAAARRSPWIWGLGVVTGGGAWATHFVAMLAYQPGFSMQFSALWTTLSIVAGVLGSTTAFAFLVRFKSRAGSAMAGLVFALAIACLHFSGMKGINGADRVWDVELVAWSVLVCAILGVAGAAACSHARGWKGRAAGFGLLAASVVSLHFTAMSALHLAPLASHDHARATLSGSTLAVLITVVLCAILLVVAALIYSEARVIQTRVAGAERMRRLGSAALEGLMMHNGQHIIDANDRFLALVGESLEAVAGSDLSRYAPAKTLTHLEAAQGDFAAIEAVLKTSSGPRDVQLLTRQLEPGLYVTAVRDLAAERRAAVAEMESQAKSQFLATMSHELRTPLTSIVSYAELLREVALEEGRDSEAADAGVIIGASRDLLALISQILDYSKLEAGKLGITFDTFDPADLLNEVAVEARHVVDSHANKLDLRIGPALPAICADRLRVKQCVLNLLSNAAKFTKNGVITLHARASDQNAVSGIEIVVEDTGIGMSPRVLATLFKPFQQADGSIERQYGGTGLGLAITHQLAARMHGSIVAESAEGKGSRFTLWLPLGPANDVEAVQLKALEVA